MKNNRSLSIILLIIIFGVVQSCQHTSKENTWSEEQKTNWKTECQQKLIDRGLKASAAADFCDCMLKKTSQKYTPEETKKLTIEEVRKLWDECDYQW